MTGLRRLTGVIHRSEHGKANVGDRRSMVIEQRFGELNATDYLLNCRYMNMKSTSKAKDRLFNTDPNIVASVGTARARRALP